MLKQIQLSSHGKKKKNEIKEKAFPLKKFFLPSRQIFYDYIL